MSSRRCSICATEWPDSDKYSTCPNCGEGTWRNSKGTSHEHDVDADEEPTTKRDGKKRMENEWLVHNFRAWLDTVTADDFKAWIRPR